MLKIPSLDALDATSVETRLTTLADTVDSFNLGIDVSRGVFRDLVLRMHAILEQATDDAAATAIISAIPALGLDFPATVDSDILTSVAKSVGITARAAKTSSGSIKIVVSNSDTVFIPISAIFATPDGQSFVTKSAFSAKTNAVNISLSNERTLVKRTDGKYEFFIEVTSQSSNSQVNVRKGTAFTPSNITIAGFVSAEANTDFAGGADAESVSELLNRLVKSQPAKTPLTRHSIASYLLDVTRFPGLLGISVIGSGDPEMRRDKSTVFPGGNKVDVYVRPSIAPQTTTVVLDAIATKVINGLSATWTVSIPRTALPGFYRVTDIRFIDSSEELTIIKTDFGADISGIEGERVPSSLSPVEGAFTRYATAALTFESPSLNKTEGDVKTVQIALEGMPQIAQIQTALSNRLYNYVNGDILVKAAVPCFVSAGITINVRTGGTIPNAANIRLVAAQAINSQTFSGQLFAAQIGSQIQAILSDGAFVSKVDIAGSTLMPDGTIRRDRSTEVISAPVEYAQSVSPRTVAFISDVSNISVYLADQLNPRTP